MAKLAVNPTKMVLRQLKARLARAQRGHQLLKDQQDELMRHFIQLSRENNRRRQEVRQQIEVGLRAYALAETLTPASMLTDVLTTIQQPTRLQVDQDKMLNIDVPQLTLLDESSSATPTYSYLDTNYAFDEALTKMLAVREKMIALAEIEKKVQLVANELSTVRRRVNALEHLIIPQLEETIQFIERKLAENKRAEKVRLIKIKDM